MSNFKEKFIGYSNYINNNGNDANYIEKCPSRGWVRVV